MRIAMEDRERADDHRRHSDRRPHREADHGAQDHDREGNAGLDRRGMCKPLTPSAPPKAITIGKTIGNT